MCCVQESYKVTCTPEYLRLYRPAACTFEHLPPNVYTYASLVLIRPHLECMVARYAKLETPE